VRSASTATDASAPRWLAAAGAAFVRVADGPSLWMAGGLAWLTTVGWIPFVVAVVRPPTVAEITYLGSGFWTSGLWPLNVILLAAAAVAAVVLALALASAGNAVLHAFAAGRRASTIDAGRLLIAALMGAVPVAVCLLMVAVATIAVGPTEFNRPGADSSPLLRLAGRVAPLLVFGAVVAIAASTLAGVAGRAAVSGRSVARGVSDAPALLRRAGRAGLWHLGVSIAIGAGYLALGGLLLAVLWAPIRAGFESGAGPDLSSGLLLVGFVAIWLCLVLAGGAVHAWASVTATILLGDSAANDGAERPQEMLLDR
jgi:hypothetical protein